MQKQIVIISYNSILLPKIQFKSCMQEILILYYKYAPIEYLESNVMTNLLLSLLAIFSITVYYIVISYLLCPDSQHRMPHSHILGRQFTIVY